ncbi:MAG: hypothetical protein M1821_006310 [Bathelium mastoideum]|nr:MAG: hypothetical protein M1821_006310 [Bathelium mastoideum]KAI9686655.1 MAG: hypothetical protein M1822_003666 [Bathelium mastoideum]
MPSASDKSQLKRGRPSVGEEVETKKPRRSQRISSREDLKASDRPAQPAQLLSPVTHSDSNATERMKQSTESPGQSKDQELHTRQPTPLSSPPTNGLSSPPQDTQPFSQFIYPPQGRYWEVEDEAKEAVWGYLLPIDDKLGSPLVLKQRTACPKPYKRASKTEGEQHVQRNEYEKREEEYEEKKVEGVPSGGYLIGRHPECDRMVDSPVVSNRHTLFFSENKGGGALAMLEDLSGNGTFVNEALVGRNKRRELEDGDEISIVNEARFIFRYPHSRETSAFKHKYQILEQLGKGHFATVFLCVDKESGNRFAVKKFEKRSGQSERSKVDGLQQEVAVLMGVSHPSVLCLRDTFDESDGFYLVLELAPEGELFNWIVMKQKLTEAETRKIFIQLFQGIKYLHERNIVHRDIKPENILMTDKDLNVKLADFGLAKIIGEESFTTTLCGTPSYVAPEILEQSNHRRYTRAVDVWSLGVVLYICLCGFPPFSDELYSAENPYTLSQQIKAGRFDYPSPYWDPVSDAALDLIDRMLTVSVNDRISIDECLEHPWTTGAELSLNDSTDGLTGRIQNLDFKHRKPVRERTLLASINDVKITHVIGEPTQDEKPIKVFEKNAGKPVSASKTQTEPLGTGGNDIGNGKVGMKELDPAHNRNPEDFIGLGGKGDVALFGDDSGSIYEPEKVVKAPS